MFRTRSLRTAIVAGAFGLALLISACGGSTGGSSAPGTIGEGGLKGKTIALVGYGNSNPWGSDFNEVYNGQLAWASPSSVCSPLHWASP